MHLRRFILISLIVVVGLCVGVGVYILCIGSNSSKVEIINKDRGLKVVYNPEDPLWKSLIGQLGVFDENGIYVLSEDSLRTNLTTVKKIKIFIEPSSQLIVMNSVRGETVVSWNQSLKGDELEIYVNINYLTFNKDIREELTGNRYRDVIAFLLASFSVKQYSKGTFSPEHQWKVLDNLIDLEKTEYLNISIL